MSGIEVAGLILGASPLLIAVIEHYEKTAKVARTWWRFRTTYARDIRMIKDCQTFFKLNLRLLLEPLTHDGVVSRRELEALLADLSDPGWKDAHVELALRERLSDYYERYLEVLLEIKELTMRLLKEYRVDDEEFQAVLKAKNEMASPTNNQQSRKFLMLKANVEYQTKRVKYAFTESTREKLLGDIEKKNDRLHEVLARIDRVSLLSSRKRSPEIRRPNPEHLTFWTHAASIFRLLDKVWKCQCRSQVGLWLQHRSFHEVCEVHMKMHLKLCCGQQCVQWQFADTLSAMQRGIATFTGPNTQSVSQVPSVVMTGCSSTTVAAISSTSGSVLTPRSKSTATPNTPSTSMTAASNANSLENDGLCRTYYTAHNPNKAPGIVLGRLSDGVDEYAVCPIVHTVPSTTFVTLANLLCPHAPLRLPSVRRYEIALILASNHLQLHSTPWLEQYWTSKDVRFPTSINGTATMLDGEPYILARLPSATNRSSQTTNDRSFSTLAIVLLELCFGIRIEDHPTLWSNTHYASGKSDPGIRQAVAHEWRHEVQGEAGEQYAAAVTWMLLQSPATAKDDSWRADFAQNVVQPLQRHYEFLDPKK